MSVEYFQQYGRLDKILDMTFYVEIRERLDKLIIFFGVIWVTSSACDFIAWLLLFGILTPLVYSVAYLYLLIKMLTVLDLIAQVMQIEFRLRCIGDYIQDNYCMADKNKSFAEDCMYIDNWLYTKNGQPEAKTLKKALDVALNAGDEIKFLSKYYLLLIEQTAFINKMYGMRTLGAVEYFPVFSNLTRLLTCVAVIITLVDVCEKAYRQRERIFNSIDHYVIMGDPNNTVAAAMVKFRELVDLRPVTFHMAYFFRFDYSLLVSIASVVVTYTIIILQSVN
ncbi:unnamed protein product, partial [Iphiclides podalirius]